MASRHFCLQITALLTAALAELIWLEARTSTRPSIPRAAALGMYWSLDTTDTNGCVACFKPMQAINKHVTHDSTVDYLGKKLERRCIEVFRRVARNENFISGQGTTTQTSEALASPDPERDAGGGALARAAAPRRSSRSAFRAVPGPKLAVLVAIDGAGLRVYAFVRLRNRGSC